MEEQHQRAQLQKRKRLISPSQRAGNGSVCSSRFQPLYISLGNTSLLTADPGSVCSSHAMPGNLCMNAEKLRVHNKKRTRTPTRKKFLNHTALACTAGDHCGNKPSGMPQFSALFMILKPPPNRAQLFWLGMAQSSPASVLRDRGWAGSSASLWPAAEATSQPKAATSG